MDFKKIENNKPTVRLISFLISIVPTSVAVSYASFVGNAYLLAAALFPCIITLSFSIVPVPVSARLILAFGIFSSVVSVAIIIYTLIVHPVVLKPYMTLPF
jgi:hypothetical protein